MPDTMIDALCVDNPHREPSPFAAPREEELVLIALATTATRGSAFPGVH